VVRCDENGLWSDYLQLVDDRTEAVTLARERALATKCNAWFQEEETPCRSIANGRTEAVAMETRGAQTNTRRAARIPAERISVWAPGSGARLKLRDMSRDGFGVLSENPCDVGFRQEFAFMLPGAWRTVTAFATAIHCTPTPEGFIIGWAFTTSDGRAQILSDFDVEE
jgi:hypothetical protein